MCSLPTLHGNLKHFSFLAVFRQRYGTLIMNFLQARYTRDWNQIMMLLVDISHDKVNLFLVRYIFQTVLHIWREWNNRRHGELPKLVPQIIQTSKYKTSYLLLDLWDTNNSKMDMVCHKIKKSEYHFVFVFNFYYTLSKLKNM